jgi:two-component system response regulator YesN
MRKEKLRMNSKRKDRLLDIPGIDVVKETEDVAPSVLVLIVTANGDEEAAVEAFGSGALDYLKKAFSISEPSRRKNILSAPDTKAQPGPPPASVTLSRHHKIQQAVRFINDNYRTDIRLASAAREAGMSSAHFSRMFKKVMGLSYQEYLNSRRITKAKNLLRTSAQSVTEIAVSLGFSDQTGFGRIFKKLTGHTPSAFRNLLPKSFFAEKSIKSRGHVIKSRDRSDRHLLRLSRKHSPACGLQHRRKEKLRMHSKRKDQLPDMPGIDVVKEIEDVAPSVLVLIVTANGDEEAAVEAFGSGALDYLKKAFSISEPSRRKNILPASDTQAHPCTPPAPVTLSRHHKIQQAVRFINDNYRTDIRLAAAAREAGMSPAHFSRMFKKVMGLSYQEYLNSRRITKAKNLLRTSAQSVTEIAVSLGFADQTGFGRIFKKLTGHTPSAFRSLSLK